MTNPLADGPDDDVALVASAQGGSRDALEALVRKHQAWIYNIALRMLYAPQDAQDATQEVLVKLVTRLSTFEGRSAFRTWLYRIAVNHVLNVKRSLAEEAGLTFERYGAGLRGAPDEELPDPNAVPVDVALLVEEARIGCTTGMLLCLSREQRIVYVLGAIFGVTDAVGAEILETSRDNFRQRLSRARRDLHQFMDGQCGLVAETNPCRCAKKTRAFMRAGYVDPAKLLFVEEHVTTVRQVAPRAHTQLQELDEAYAEVHRAHPFASGPDFVASLRKLVAGLAMTVLLAAAPAAVAERPVAGEIVALEKGALDRWSQGDPSGFYAIMADEETYFDPLTEARVDGLSALKAHIAPFAGRFRIERYEMLNPRVDVSGDVAVLTFNLVNHGARFDGRTPGTSRWNSTEVFRRSGGRWRIVHSHWSPTKPSTQPAP
ncbi:MAG: sigma-70 family RNA polymerase sigma factor [Vicinamibacteria bacterium]